MQKKGSIYLRYFSEQFDYFGIIMFLVKISFHFSNLFDAVGPSIIFIIPI